MEKLNISSQFIVTERMGLLAKIAQLRKLLSELSAMIHTSTLPAYSPDVAPFDPDKTEEHAEARMVIAKVIKQLHYQDEQEPNESICFPGIMFANDKMLELILQVNDSKKQIKSTFIRLSQIQVTQFGKNYMMLDKFILQGTDESRLSKLETYRNIFSASAEHRVKTIGFTWANVPVTKQMNTTEAKAYIVRTQFDEMKRNSDIGLLDDLDPFEVLARERRAPTKSRINVTYEDKTLFKDGKKMYTGVLPFFIHEKNLGQTKVYPLKSKIGSQIKNDRKRSKLEQHPYCRFSPIFRYQEPFRRIVLPENI